MAKQGKKKRKTHAGGRPRKGTTVRRDALETIALEVIAFQRDLDEIGVRMRQAVRRTPTVHDVLEPGVERIAQMSGYLNIISDQLASAWADEMDAWSRRD